MMMKGVTCILFYLFTGPVRAPVVNSGNTRWLNITNSQSDHVLAIV